MRQFLLLFALTVACYGARCPPFTHLFLRGEEKSGTTFFEYVIEHIIREHCNGSGECMESGNPRSEYYSPFSKKSEQRGMTVLLADGECEWHFSLGGDKHSTGLARQPGLRYALIFRDPRDVLLSAREFFVREDRGGHAYFSKILGDMAALYANAQGQDCIVVFYELLLSNPEAEVRRVAGELGFDLSDRALAAVLERTSLDHMRKLERGGELRGLTKSARYGAKVREGRPGAWRDEYTGSDAARLTEAMKRALQPALLEMFKEL